MSKLDIWIHSVGRFFAFVISHMMSPKVMPTPTLIKQISMK